MSLPLRSSSQLVVDRSPGVRIARPGRVVFVSGVLEASGGLELFELDAARALEGRGWDVTCLFDQPGDLADRWDRAGARRLRHDDAGADRAIRAADVVYVHETTLLPKAIALASRYDRPVVGHLHLPPFHLRRGWRGRLLGRHRHPVDDAVLGRRTRVDRFIAVSHHTRRVWIEAGLPAARVEVVHNGVDVDRFRPAMPGERDDVRRRNGIDPEAFVVGFVGRIDPAKGVRELLRAFGSVASATSRHMELVLVGEPSRWSGDEGAAFAQTVRRASPAGTQWLGKRADVDELYRAMDLLVVPSQWDEPFGLVAAEALASGVAVLATRRGGLPEVLRGPLAVNVVGTSWRSIAAGIRRHVDDPGLGPELGRQGRRVVEREFALARTVESIERVLRGVR
jgi:glycosyltransferase involved in cell wall biosynthesis